jgi:hypothetical protein
MTRDRRRFSMKNGAVGMKSKRKGGGSMSVKTGSNSIEAFDWTLIAWEYHRRQERRLRDIVQPSFIPCPNRRLSGWEDTPKGRVLVLRNVDRVLMRMSEKTVMRLTAATSGASYVEEVV